MTLEQVAEQVQGDYKHRIILATVDGKADGASERGKGGDRGGLSYLGRQAGLRNI